MSANLMMRVVHRPTLSVIDTSGGRCPQGTTKN
jgi:hypothetical protein